MRFVVFTIVLLIATSVWSWPFSNRSVDMNISTLAEVEADVPVEYVDMEPQQRKYEFVEWILPIVERQNDQILQLRKIVLQIQRKELFRIPITENEQNFLNMLQLEYGGNSIQDLLERINIIPASMVIAQASLESGWGSSRFAQEGNNLFGIRTYDPNVPGLTPLGNTNANFKVKSYLTVDDSVADYIFLLNTHYAYEDLRNARAYMSKRFNMDVHALADTLLDYSELGSQYIEMVHKHITNIERILDDIN